MTGVGEPGFDLATAVPAAEPGLLLPDRRAGEESRLALPLRLVAARALPGTGPGSAPDAWATLVADSEGRLLSVPMVRDGSVRGGVRRARAGDRAAERLLALLASGRDEERFQVLAMHPVSATVESSVDVDQTHDSVVVGATPSEAVVVKWAVNVDPAPGPPASLASVRHLDAVGFTAMPEPVGFLVHGSADGQALVASAARFLPGALDGWDWYVDDLLAHLDGRLDGAASVRPAAEIGTLVARMHAAFGTAWSQCTDPVTRAGTEEAERWLRQALGTIAEAEQVTTGAAGDRLRSRSAVARAVVRSGLSAAPGTPMTRVHGDLHVGQVLRWEGGYAVSDFDGNPVLPAGERSLGQPPARDVAGMLRSLDHVARIVDRRTEHAYDRRLRDWTAQVRQAFLSAYRTELGVAGHGDLFDESLLAAFEVEQECRELVYAARHLPRWTYVPDAALTELLPLPGGTGG